MSLTESETQSEPFNEPLAPLPRKKGDKSQVLGRPQAVMAELPPSGQVDVEKDAKQRKTGKDGLSVFAKVERLGRGKSDRAEVVPRWKFWKRSARRNEQAETLRQGATEMVELMRSIRDHLEGGHVDRDGILKSLSPLPTAVESLKSMSDRQAETGRTLEGLHKTLEQRANRDGLLLKSLNRMGSTMSHVEETFGKLDRTLAGMDQSNQSTARNMELLGDRMADTGQFMNESFAQLRDAEREFTSYISKSTRRSGMAMVAVCSLLVMSVVAVGFMFRENRNLLSAVQQNGALVVQVPSPSTPTSAAVQNIAENRVPVGNTPARAGQRIERPPGSSDVDDDKSYPVETESPRLIPINDFQEKK